MMREELTFRCPECGNAVQGRGFDYEYIECQACGLKAYLDTTIGDKLMKREELRIKNLKE